MSWRTFAIAASLLIFLGGALGDYFWTHRGLYTTGAGEERTLTLADGSRIELNARTRLRVRYSQSSREIELLAGQALFQVARDPARPFVVRSGEATVRAVGTQFDVYRRDSGTTVTVLEGRVAVYSSARPVQSDSAGQNAPSEHSVLSAGEQLTISAKGTASTPHATNVAAATAWTRGQLEFEETPLSEAADDFNRLSPRPLVIEDAQLRGFRISGVYSSVDPSSLILFLRNQPDLVVTETDSEFEVSRRNR